jgi:putative phage-type endonuclease
MNDLIEQGTDAWHKSRLGKVTASRISDVMARTKTGYGASRKNYMMELLCQRLTGQKQEGYVNAAMQRGIDLEPMAAGMYEGITGVLTAECAFIDHPTISMSGASPDRLVGTDGLVEIKCPNTAQHVEFLRTGEVDRDYILQMHWQMDSTGRRWCDYVSFDDRMPQELQYKCKRVAMDAKLMAQITDEVKQFLVELNALEAEMRALIKA